MTKNTDATQVADISSDFDLSELDAVDESRMTVVANGKLTSWVWTFAGPGHPQTVATTEARTRQRLHRDRELEQQQRNGRKVKIPEETPEELAEKNVALVLDRLLGWTPINLHGSDYPFTRENARAILLDPRKVSLLIQALDFLGDEQAFTSRSAKS